MPEKTKAEVKFSSFEYQGSFADPVFDTAPLVSAGQAVYAALKPWNISPQDAKYIFPVSSVADPVISFELANRKYLFSLAHSAIALKVDWADWSQAELIIQMAETFKKTVTGVLNTEVTGHRLNILIQVVLEGKLIKDITKPLAAPLKRMVDDLDCYGFILHTTRGLFLVDKSVVNPNGLFMRIEHRFDGQTTFTKMAEALHADELWLADVLALEIV